MVLNTSTSTPPERAMRAKKEFEDAWEEVRKIFARPRDTPADDPTRNNAPKLSYRHENSLGGTDHEYYADGTEKQDDDSTAEPITLGRRIVLGYARPAAIGGLVKLHSLYQAESGRLNATYEANDSDPQVEYLNRPALRAVPEQKET